MKAKIEVDTGSKTPIYKQIVQSLQNMISIGQYHESEFIPSMNELANELNISKETVKKAYNILREKGIIESSHGKGFFVNYKSETKIKILFLFDKISTYKQVLFSSIVKDIGNISENTICLHNQDIDLFEYFINENLGHYDYYIITPHFPLKPEIQKRAVKILKKIPNRKLIILDHLIKGLSGNFGSAYQDFEHDIFEGLRQVVGDLTKFKKLNIISMPGSLYAPLIEKGIQKFCQEYQVKFEIQNNIEITKIQKHEAYFILNGQLDIELIELVKSARSKGCIIGKDIGIISYNESPINEIILDGLTVFSTNFRQMGELASKMIIEKKMKKIRCDFSLIKRNTF
jgi:DNA-binding transcriptional regulator YhcF (GntR family)